MGLTLEDDITEWFDAHPRTRDAFKHGAVYAIGYLAANWTAIALNLPAWTQPWIGTAGAAALGYLAAHISATTTWPIIGTQAPPRGPDGKFKAK